MPKGKNAKRVKGKGEIIEAKPMCPGFKDASFKDKHVLNLISVEGNEYCTGDYFAAIAKHSVENYAYTTFLIVDSLQKYNIKIHHSDAADEVLHEKALILGDEWWKKNETTFASILDEKIVGKTVDEKIKFFNKHAERKEIDCRILRWDEFIKEIYSPLNKDISIETDNKKYQTDENLKAALNNTIKEYTKRNNIKGVEEAAKLFLSYESPAIIRALAKGYYYIQYPGVMLDVLKETYKHFLSNDQKDNRESFECWIDVYFKRTEKKQEEFISVPVSSSPDKKAGSDCLITRADEFSRAAREQYLKFMQSRPLQLPRASKINPDQTPINRTNIDRSTNAKSNNLPSKSQPIKFFKENLNNNNSNNKELYIHEVADSAQDNLKAPVLNMLNGVEQS